MKILSTIWSEQFPFVTNSARYFAGGVILAQLLEWLRWHFVEGDKLAREALESERPCDHPDYWDAVRALSH